MNYKQIQDLKMRWLEDPSFDIENYEAELKEFRDRIEAEWAERADALGVPVARVRYLEGLEEKIEDSQGKIEELETRFDYLKSALGDL